jgi:hypothetical protein
LRGFSANGKSIFQIEKESSRGYLCSVEDAAAIRDYHKLDYPGATDPHSAEKHLAEIETQHSEALRRALDGEIKVYEVHTLLIEFVSFMSFRVPAFKHHVEESLRQMVRSAGILLERNGRLSKPPDDLRDHLRMDKVDIGIHNWKCLEIMFEFASDPQLLATMAMMEHSVVHAPQSAEFLTCDQPVVFYNPKASPTDAQGTGLLTKDVAITFPLTSKSLLHLSWNVDFAENQLLSPSQVDEFNRRTIIMADSLIFASRESESLIGSVVRYGQYSAGTEQNTLAVGAGYLYSSRLRPAMATERYAPTTDSR